jgi:hypothetical protein
MVSPGCDENCRRDGKVYCADAMKGWHDFSIVMPGFMPGIHVFLLSSKGVDGRAFARRSLIRCCAKLMLWPA